MGKWIAILAAVASVLALALIALRWFAARRAKKNQIHALVWFLNEPREMTASDVKEVVTRALGVELDPVKDDGDEKEGEEESSTGGFVVGEAPMFVVKIGEWLLLVNCFDKPYVDDPQAAAEHIRDPRLKDAMIDHKAWVSVDLMQGPFRESDAALEEGYRMLGKIAAELQGDDCLALHCLVAQNAHLPDHYLTERLRGPNPLESLSENSLVPIVHIANDDPRMVAAVEDARAHWPRFVDAWERRQKSQHFAVKGAFGDEDHREFMWLSVTAIEGDVAYGILDNDPMHAQNGRLGDRKQVTVSDLNDWMIRDDNTETTEGGFTVKVLTEAMKKSTK